MNLILSGLALALFLTVYLASRDLRRISYWAGLWGAVLGVIVVAPALASVHNLRISAFGHVVVLWAFVVAVAVPMGAVLVTVVSWPVATLMLVLRANLRAPVVAAALWSLVWLPIAYVGASLTLERIRLGSIHSLEFGDAVWAAIAAVAGGLALGVAYRRMAGGPWRDGRRLIVVALVILTAGTAALGFRLERAPLVQDVIPPPLVQRSGIPRPAPLVVIGLDGGNWATLEPLLGTDIVPALSKIVRDGVRGDVEAAWPPYWSGPAWAAIVTGYDRSHTGVREDLAATVPGLPAFELPLDLNLILNPYYAVEIALMQAGLVHAMPMPRVQLQRSPIWERLSGSGRRIGVVRFPFTYPAVRHPDLAVVANVISTDLWRLAGVSRVDTRQMASPPALAERVLARFAQPPDGNSPGLRAILPQANWPKPRDAVFDPSEVLAAVFDIIEKTFDAAEETIRRDPAMDLVMLHIGGIDNIFHAFWPYRFPEAYAENPPAAEDVGALGPVIERSLGYVDRRIARIIALLPRPPNVIVVADHGQEASPDHPVWRGWHSRFGVFAAAGPGITARSDSVRVSYLDVAPLILDLMGFEPAADLTGDATVVLRRKRDDR